MKRILLAAGLFLLPASAWALPLPGFNTAQGKCISTLTQQIDPIKQPGLATSDHMHDHFGKRVDKDSSSKTIDGTGDTVPSHDNPPGTIPPVQHLPNIVNPPIDTVSGLPSQKNAAILDPGYGPLDSSCFIYGDWSWYAIPTPLTNGTNLVGNTGPVADDRTWTQSNEYVGGGATHNETAGVMTLTWAVPYGQKVVEMPFGAALVAGNPHAMSEADNPHLWWTCGGLGFMPNEVKSSHPIDCTNSGGGGGTTTTTTTPNPNLPALLSAFGMASSDVTAKQNAMSSAISSGDQNQVVTAQNALSASVSSENVALNNLQAAVNNPTVTTTTTGGSSVVSFCDGSSTPCQYNDYGVVTGVLEFPDCWDGQNAYHDQRTGGSWVPDSPANVDPTKPAFGIGVQHFGYSDATSHACPASFPVHVTKLYMANNFGDLTTGRTMVNPFNADGSYKLSFSSGPYYTLHSDWGNLWNVGLGGITYGCLNNRATETADAAHGGGIYYGGYLRLDGSPTLTSCNIGSVPTLRCPIDSNDPNTDSILSGDQNYVFDRNTYSRKGLFICKDQDAPHS